MSNSVGVFLKFNKPSNVTKAHILADQLFTFMARVSMEDAEVLTLLVEMLEEGADGEQALQEPLTEAMLRSVAHHVEVIRDEPLQGYEHYPTCSVCGECMKCGLRPCRNGMGHTA